MNYWKEFWQEEDGIGIVELILILVILVAIVLLFRKQISKMVTDALGKITGNGDEIMKDI